MVEPQSNQFSFGKRFKIRARTSSRAGLTGGRGHHARVRDCRMLAGQGRPRPSRGLATAWPLLAAVLLPHLAAVLLATALTASRVPSWPWATGRL